MCTPQIQQAIAAGQAGAAMGQSAPQAIYPKQVIEAAILGGLGGQANAPQNMMHEHIEDIVPQNFMRKEYAPMPTPPVQRQPTVGEILGIKPGSTPGI